MVENVTHEPQVDVNAGSGTNSNGQSSLNAEPNRWERLILLFSVFVVGGCGLLYELINGAVASYLVGDTVTQYSLVIGVFLAAMGLGAWVTQWIHQALLDWFIASPCAN